MQTRWTKTRHLLNSIQANKTRKISRKSNRLIAKFQENNEFQLQAQLTLTDVLRTLMVGSQLVRDKPSMQTRRPAIFKIKSNFKASHRISETPRVYKCRTTSPVRSWARGVTKQGSKLGLNRTMFMLLVMKFTFNKIKRQKNATDLSTRSKKTLKAINSE